MSSGLQSFLPGSPSLTSLLTCQHPPLRSHPPPTLKPTILFSSPVFDCPPCEVPGRRRSRTLSGHVGLPPPSVSMTKLYENCCIYENKSFFLTLRSPESKKFQSLGGDRSDLTHSREHCMWFTVAIATADLRIACVLPLCRTSAASPSRDVVTFPALSTKPGRSGAADFTDSLACASWPTLMSRGYGRRHLVAAQKT